MGRIAADDLSGMHSSVVRATHSADDIGESRIRIDERVFNFKGSLVIHAVPVNDVGNFKPRKPYFTNALELVIERVAFQIQLTADMRKHTITLTFPDVESLPISGVNESVNVGPEFA